MIFISFGNKVDIVPPVLEMKWVPDVGVGGLTLIPWQGKLWHGTALSLSHWQCESESGVPCHSFPCHGIRVRPPGLLMSSVETTMYCYILTF